MSQLAPMLKLIGLYSPTRTQHQTELFEEAITHSSASSTKNNISLARIGELSAKALVLEYEFKKYRKTRRIVSGSESNEMLNRFTVKKLAELGKNISLSVYMKLGGGAYTVSEAMLAQCLNAIFGAIKLGGEGQGEEDLLKVLIKLGLIEPVAEDEVEEKPAIKRIKLEL